MVRHSKFDISRVFSKTTYLHYVDILLIVEQIIDTQGSVLNLTTLNLKHVLCIALVKPRFNLRTLSCTKMVDNSSFLVKPIKEDKKERTWESICLINGNLILISILSFKLGRLDMPVATCPC